MATKYSMYRGDYRELPAIVTDTFSNSSKVFFAVKDPSIVDAIDNTDANAVFTVDVLGSDSTSVTNNGNGTVTFTIKITPALTSAKTPGLYEAQIRYQDAAGHLTSYPTFDFELLGDLNQRS